MVSYYWMSDVLAYIEVVVVSVDGVAWRIRQQSSVKVDAAISHLTLASFVLRCIITNEAPGLLLSGVRSSGSTSS